MYSFDIEVHLAANSFGKSTKSKSNRVLFILNIYKACIEFSILDQYKQVHFNQTIASLFYFTFIGDIDIILQMDSSDLVLIHKSKKIVIPNVAVTNLDLSDADDFYKEKKYHEAIAILQSHKWEHNPYILWRLARCKHRMRFQQTDGKDKLSTEAQEHIKHAAELTDTIGQVHKWSVILFKASWDNWDKHATTSPLRSLEI